MPAGAPHVSVLIPVFNAAQHLRECLDSAVGQSLENIEIICVDDASTDASATVIHGFQQSDGRIRHLKHDRNQGEGAARNTAIDHARGDYVFHLDADDTIPSSALERLWRTASEHRSEMVKGGFSINTFDGKSIARNHEAARERVINTQLAESVFLQRIPVSHCSYLYERAFLNRNGLRYRTDMSVGLDLVALSEALVAASRVSLLPDPVYTYRRTPGSATRSQVQPDTVAQAIRAKALVCENLLAAGHRAAARAYVSVWDWQLKALWAGMSPDTPMTAMKSIFSRFRETIPEGLVPWSASSPLAHRYLLSLVLLERDREARAFLWEVAEWKAFEKHPEAANRCATILQVSSRDALALECAGGSRA